MCVSNRNFLSNKKPIVMLNDAKMDLPMYNVHTGVHIV